MFAITFVWVVILLYFQIILFRLILILFLIELVLILILANILLIENKLFLFESKLSHKLCDFVLDSDNHGDDWVELNVRDLEFLDGYDDSKIRFQQLVIYFEKYVFLVELKVLKKL